MTVLDELIVKIGLDSKGFQQGLKKVEVSLDGATKKTEKAGKDLEQVGKKGADAFSSFRMEAMAALALFTGSTSIAAFTNDIAKSNVALGNLSKQLDIVPQKLTQLHAAAKAAGVNPGDIDSAFKSIQAKLVDPTQIGAVTRLEGLMGVSLRDKDNHVRGDIFDQLAQSKVWHSLSRGVQQNYAQQLGISDGLVNLVDRKDYMALQKQFEGLGPTKEQISLAERQLADWEALKANTNQVMQQVFSDIEPTVDNFVKALTHLEKVNTKGIADGVEQVAETLGLLSALLTAKKIGSMLGLIGDAAITAPAAAVLGVTAAAPIAAGNYAAKTGKSPFDTTGVGQLYGDAERNAALRQPATLQDPSRADLEQHYYDRTGAVTPFGFKAKDERRIWDAERNAALRQRYEAAQSASIEHLANAAKNLGFNESPQAQDAAKKIMTASRDIAYSNSVTNNHTASTSNVTHNTGHTIHIDARGSHDEGRVHEAAMTGVQKALSGSFPSRVQ